MTGLNMTNACRRPVIWLTVFLIVLLVLCTMPPTLATPPPKKTQATRASVDSESQSFLANLRARVLNNWLLPDGKNVVVLEATVNTNGDVAEVKTGESKADPLAIEAATNAFDKAQPLGHLPSKYHSDCRITLTFTSDVDPHGDSTSNLTSAIDQVAANTKLGQEGAGTKGTGGQ